MKRFAPFAAGIALTLLAPSPADATLLHYVVTGIDVNYLGQVEYASFYIDSQPALLPNNIGLDDNFRVKFISGIFQYGDTVKTLQDVDFFTAQYGGGFVTLDVDQLGSDPNISFLLNLVGPQLYSGSEAAPTLLTGEFAMIDGYSGSPLSLTVMAVPEASTWAMAITGLGAVGMALRRRRTRRVPYRLA